MTTFIDEILDLAEANLNLITTTNGYSTNMGNNVKRATTTPPKDGDLPSVNFWIGDFESNPDEYGRLLHVIPLDLEVRGLTRDEPFITVASRLLGDVGAALNRDPENAPRKDDPAFLDFGGKVRNLILRSCTFYVGEGGAPFCGALITFRVECYTPLGGDLSSLDPVQ